MKAQDQENRCWRCLSLNFDLKFLLWNANPEEPDKDEYHAFCPSCVDEMNEEGRERPDEE
jgi:hypothetical protein